MAETRLLRIDTFTFHILHIALHLHQECTSVKLALRRGGRLEEPGGDKRQKRAKAFHRSRHLISGHVWCFLWSAQLSACLCDQDVCRWCRRQRCSEVVPFYGVTKLQSQLPFLRVILFFFFFSPHAISSTFNLLQCVMPPFTSVYYVLIVHGHFLLPC